MMAALGVRFARLTTAVLLVSLGLAACSNPTVEEQALARKRLSLQQFESKNDIHLAVVWNKSRGAFLSGAMLAAEEINAEGGVLGRKLELEFTDESAFLDNEQVRRTSDEGRYRNALAEAGVGIAKSVMANPSVTAVIGHMDSDAALSAMLAYQENGVLMLSGNATDSRVKWLSNNLYFQMRPKNEVEANYMANVIAKHNWRTSYIVYEATRHNEHIAELLKTAFSNYGIQIAGTVAITANGLRSAAGMQRVQKDLAELSTGSVDVVVLLAPPDIGVEVIKKSRSMGVFQPFLATSALEVPAVLGLTNKGGVETLFTSLYRKENYQVKRFAERLSKRFPDVIVDETALMGYDSVRLYAEAVASAGTTDPLVLAHTIHFKLPVWYGLLGSYVFKDGNNTALKYFTHKIGGNQDGTKPMVAIDDPT